MADESGKGLGLEAEGEVSEVDAIFADDPVDEAPAPAPEPEPTPAPEAPAETEAETPEAEGAEAEAPEEPAVAEEPQETPYLWAGRFDDPKKLEESYKEAQRWATRESQARAEAERRAAAIEAQFQQTQEQLKQILPELQRRMAEEQGYEPGQDPFTQQQQQAAAIQEAARKEAQRLMEQERAQRTQAEAQQAISQFRSEHPEVAPGTPLEADIYRLFREYQSEDANFLPTPENLNTVHSLATDPRVKGVLDSLNLFPDPEYVTRAKELAEDPALATVVIANPHLIDTEQGMAWARSQVRPATQTPNTEVSQQRAAEMKKNAHVEKGSSGVPAAAAPGARPDDWLSEIKAVEERDQPTSKALGI